MRGFKGKCLTMLPFKKKSDNESIIAIDHKLYAFMCSVQFNTCLWFVISFDDLSQFFATCHIPSIYDTWYETKYICSKYIKLMQFNWEQIVIARTLSQIAWFCVQLLAILPFFYQKTNIIKCYTWCFINVVLDNLKACLRFARHSNK